MAASRSGVARPSPRPSKIPATPHMPRSARLPGQERGDACDRVQVLRDELVVAHLDAVTLLEVVDELEDAGRIDDAGLEQGVVVAELPVVAEEEPVGDEPPDLRAHLGFFGLWGHGTCS